jgi:AraC-like DNA-binding protein
MMSAVAKALKLIKDEEVEYVDIRFTDPKGKLQHVTLVADLVDEDFFEEGFMFDGSSIAGWKSIDQSDMKLMPDAASVYLDPFYAEKTLCVHCNVVEPDTGEAYSRCPRQIALKAEAYLKSSGIGDAFYCGPEADMAEAAQALGVSERTLARRMQAVGNFNRLTRAREQAFYADAATRLANAQHLATANREALVRLIGLDEAQAQALRLPARLPDLPAAALTPEAVGALATRGRLDVRLAHGAWVGAGRAQGLNLISSLTDIELTARRNTVTDEASGSRASSRGLEIGVRLPLFDAGGLQRDAWNARTQAAAWQLEDTLRAAGSSLRENYSAYRTAYDLARHYRDEVLPVRRVISDENLLRYNGMLIGVFELLADARDQVGTVVAAIGAQQQFWLADAALQAAVIGRPTLAPTASTSGAPASGGAAAAH